MEAIDAYAFVHCFEKCMVLLHALLSSCQWWPQNKPFREVVLFRDVDTCFFLLTL